MTTYEVTTPAVSRVCDQLDRAVQVGRALLDRARDAPGSRADCGDPDLARAVGLFTERWSWELQRQLRRTDDVSHRTRAVVGLYDEVERDSLVRLGRGTAGPSGEGTR